MMVPSGDSLFQDNVPLQYAAPLEEKMNDSVLDESYRAVATAFGKEFTLIAGMEGSPLRGDYIIRIRESGVRASYLTPALVIRLTEDSQDDLAAMASEARHDAIERLCGVVKTSWGARLTLPYDCAIRGTEVSM
jgi:hypothetical protein